MGDENLVFCAGMMVFVPKRVLKLAKKMKSLMALPRSLF